MSRLARGPSLSPSERDGVERFVCFLGKRARSLSRKSGKRPDASGYESWARLPM